MIKIKENYYKLCHVDTCIISEMIKDKKTVFKNSLSELISKNTILCISVYTLFELNKRKDLFYEFINYFCRLPFFLLKNNNQLLADEFSSYPELNDYSDFSNKHIDIFNFSHFSLKDNPEKLFQEYLDKSNFTDYCKKFEEDKHKILKGILDLKSNYSNEKYSEFIEQVVLQQLILNDKNFVKNIFDKNGTVSISNFKFLKMMAYIVFYKFYNTNRNPKISDVADIIMSSAYPYMDVIITERNQADYLNKIKKIDDFIVNLEIMILIDLR